MSLQNKIDRIIEDRQAEAAQKNINKKLMAILNGLGVAVLSQYGGSGGVEGLSAENSEAPEWWGLGFFGNAVEGEDIPIIDSDPSIVGYHFDGLSSGVNMQIYFQNDLLRVNYNGVLVYRESFGQIDCYAPSPEWESKLDMFFTLAQKKNKLKERKEEADNQVKSSNKLNKVFKYLREYWGI